MAGRCAGHVRFGTLEISRAAASFGIAVGEPDDPSRQALGVAIRNPIPSSFAAAIQGRA